MRFFCSPITPVAASAATLSAFALLLSAAPAAHAQQTLAQSTTANGGFFDAAPGQSVTIGGSGAFNNLVFNFNANGTLAPIAPGTLYLFSQEYLGTPAALSASTPGFIASAVGNNNLYTFASTVSVQTSTQYFFYANTTATFAADSNNPYTGGIMYFAPGSSSAFQTASTFDAAFRLQGTAVVASAPEPSTLPLVGMGLISVLGVVGVARRRNQAKQTV